LERAVVTLEAERIEGSNPWCLWWWWWWWWRLVAVMFCCKNLILKPSLQCGIHLFSLHLLLDPVQMYLHTWSCVSTCIKWQSVESLKNFWLNSENKNRHFARWRTCISAHTTRVSACKWSANYWIFTETNKWLKHEMLRSFTFNDKPKSSWFQTFAMFCLLCVFFWVIPRHLNFICRHFGTLCLFHLHRQVGKEWLNLRMVGVSIWES
jgi:hypothetical protein